MQQILSPREKIILYATIGLASFSIVYKLVVAPVLNKNEDLNKDIAIAAQKIKRYTQLLENKEQIHQRYKKLAKGIDVVPQPEETLAGVLSELQNLAKDSDIRITDIRPQASSKAGALHKEIIIDLRTDGTMEGYLKFLYYIENSLSLLSVKRMQLNAKPNTQSLEGIFSIGRLYLDK